MKDLPIRTVIAVLLIALLGVVLWLGGWFQAIILGLFSVIAVYEMKLVFAKKNLKIFVIPQLILAASMFAVLYKLGMGYVMLIAVAAFTAIMMERVINPNRKTEELIASLAILVYPISLLFCFGVVGFGRNDLSRVALLCCFAGPCMADNTAYIVGSLIGKHKLCPAISPKKSIEGAIGGVIGGLLGGVLVYYAQRLWGFDVALISLLTVCFIGGIVGQFGDLFASTFKRWADIKDYGHIFPGHGGVMDRLDSAMVTAPIVAVIFKLFIA